MVKTLHLQLQDYSYPLYIGKDLINCIGKYLKTNTKSTKILVVTDSTVRNRYFPLVSNSLRSIGYDVNLVEIPTGEESKSLEQFARIQDSLVEYQLDRNSTLIALGGGVVGDLAGFAAAVYMRGIDYVQIPTTLQAQVDASVGGKTAINHPKGKNLIGAFHQPKFVLIDVNTLETLPKRDLRAGLIEVIKMGVIRDVHLFELVEENLDTILNLDAPTLIEIITRACADKADVVTRDEKESGLRMVLNYGHTFGHALEALTKYKQFRHGEAVSIGMNCAARLAVNLGMLPEADFLRQTRLLERAKLPTTFPDNLSPEDICQAMYLDKKTHNGKIRLILPTRIGEVVIRDDVTDEEIKEAIIQCY